MDLLSYELLIHMSHAQFVTIYNLIGDLDFEFEDQSVVTRPLFPLWAGSGHETTIIVVPATSYT